MSRRKLKYDDSKIIEQINTLAEYNALGVEDGENGNGPGAVYNTRRNDANRGTPAQNVKIDEHKLANKKTIAVPEIANDDTYYSLIKNKREWVEQLWKVRGYKRVFIEDMLPNPDQYDVTDRDLEFLENLNKKHLANQQVKPEDFQRIVEILETTIGLVATQEKKKHPVLPVEANRIELEKARTIIKESKELTQFTKTATFSTAFDEIYRVGLFVTLSIGMNSDFGTITRC